FQQFGFKIFRTFPPKVPLFSTERTRYFVVNFFDCWPTSRTTAITFFFLLLGVLGERPARRRTPRDRKGGRERRHGARSGGGTIGSEALARAACRDPPRPPRTPPGHDARELTRGERREAWRAQRARAVRRGAPSAMDGVTLWDGSAAPPPRSTFQMI
ncbi:Protein of unknown function, partial [Gryllus bimaculatus]